MTTVPSRVEAAIAALQAQRAVLGDAVVDLALASLRAQQAAIEPAVAAQSLRQVSIVFAEIGAGFSASRRLDPEQVAEVMDDAIARCSAVVDAHHGKLLQVTGDDILAAFGADEAREDDAERAVRCALALIDAGRALAQAVQAAHEHAGFGVRAGVHTGAVLLGGGVEAEGSIRGIAVNIAARMQQAAPADGLRISHDTYALVRGLFEVDLQPPLPVKGVDTPVQSYLVKRTKPRSFRIASRGIEGVVTRMIGREAELELLQEHFKRLFSQRRLAAVTVVAEAGIGKSRLLTEFEAWCEARPESFYLFRGRATPQTRGQPYGLLRDILAWRFQIADDDSVEQARAKMEQGLVPLFVHDDGPDLAEGHAHLLGHLIGIEWRDSPHVRGILDDPRQVRNRALHAAAQLFRRVGAADGTPVVLQLDDLHWADDASLDFLNYLAEVARDVPLLIVACSRPTLFERRTDWKSTEGVHRRIDLEPLDKTGSRLLANELLKKLPEVPAALRELVIGGSEGNPFYMEELVKMLIDQGAIVTGGAGSAQWTLDAGRLLATHVPATLTGVLQARLDGLPPAERLTLQQASVIGPVFWDRALLALDDAARQTLPRLVQRELVLPRADVGSDELREYAFKHAILHQVTYATVLKRNRRELHGKLAQWLAGQAGLRANDFLGAAAGHFEQAGDEANAAEFHARAAEHARTRLAHEAVLGHVQQGLALLDRQAGPPLPAQQALRWRLLQAREFTLDVQGRREAQRADIEALAQLAGQSGDERHRAHAAWRRGALLMRIADHPGMEAAAREAALHADRAGDAELRLMAQRMVAWALASQGDLAAGQAMAQQTLHEARALALRRVEAICLNSLGLIAERQGEVVAALELFQQALLAFQAAGDRRNEAIGRGNIGVGWLNLGALDAARRDLEEGLRLMRANGDRAIECGPLSDLSTLALWQGDDARALALARTALETAEAVQARDWAVIALLRRGEAELALGLHDLAALSFGQAQARAAAIDSPLQHDASAGVARVALARGDGDGALQALQALLEQLDQATPAGTDGPRLIELTCHQVLGRHRDGRAAHWLQRAHGALQASAARIADAALRQGFLGAIPAHRDIVHAWAAR